MSITIEWVLENSSGLILRFDVSRRDHRYYRFNEAVTAEMFFYRGDDEGNFLGYLSYTAREDCAGTIESKHSGDRQQWATMVGDVIAHWEPEWRVESPRLYRLGTWLPKPERMSWEKVAPKQVLILEHLARMLGAVEQYAKGKQGDESWALGALTHDLRSIIANQNSELRAITRDL